MSGRTRGLAATGTISSINLTVNNVTVKLNLPTNKMAKDVLRDLTASAVAQGMRIKNKDDHIVVASVNGAIPTRGTLTTDDNGLQVILSRVIPRNADAFDIKGNNIDPQSQVELKSDNGRQRDSFRDPLEFEGFICTSLVDDDDDFNNNDTGQLKGDMGEDVTGLDLSLIQQSDLPLSNALARAFIVPLYDVGDNNTLVPFVLNTPWPFPQ